MKNLFRDHCVCLSTAAIAVICAVGIIVALQAGCGPTLLWDGYGNIVVLRNKGQKALSNVVLTFPGGESKLSLLPENSDRTLIMNLRGESGLSFSFTDWAGKKHEEYKDIYLEPGYKGSVYITIDSANHVIWENNTEPFPAH